MEKTLFEFIIKYSKKQQIILIFLTLISFPFLYATLELPKIIINQAIGGIDFPKILYYPSLGIDVELEQIEFLLSLCFVFLGLVLLNGVFKYIINVFKGRLGERMLKLLRTKIYDRILTLPFSKFKKIRQGEVISIISSEVEPLGGFIGDAVALPMFQGGTLLVYIGFIFVQDPVLGLSAIALYPIQIYIIPKLQFQVNQLAKKRVQNVRKLSTHIGESLSGIKEIYVYDTSDYERSLLEGRLQRIFQIRYEIFKKKFFIKFLNNLLSHLTPFFFYSIGGYLVIEGQLTSGSLVAVIAAYKDLSSPWKELLSYYQQKEDVKIKYQQIIDQFVNEKEEPTKEIAKVEGFSFETCLDIETVSIIDEDGQKLVDRLSHKFLKSKNYLVLSSTGGGGDELALAISGLIQPDHGEIKLDQVNINHLSADQKSYHISYLDQVPYILSGSIKDNLYYAFMEVSEYPKHHSDETKFQVNLERARVKTHSEIEQLIINYIKLAKLDEDMYRFGLNHYFEGDLEETLAHLFVKIRHKFYEKLYERGMQNLVEPFDINKYNINTTVAQNLIFGTPKRRDASIDGLSKNEWVHRILDKVDLYYTLLDKGLEAVKILLEIFSASKQGMQGELFERYSFATAEKLKYIKENIIEKPDFSIKYASFEDQSLILSMCLSLTVGKHRLGLITEDIQAKIVEARKYFIENIPDNVKHNIDFFDKEKYNAGLTCRNNILYGHISHTVAHAAEKIQKLTDEVIREMHLRDLLIFIGIETDIGTAGSKLSLTQKQKLALVRSLLKRPEILVLNHCFSSLDKPTAHEILKGLQEECKEKTIIMIDYDMEYQNYFDEVVAMDKGRLILHENKQKNAS